MMLPFANSKTFCNDRFFLYNTLGFTHIGHNAHGTAPRDKNMAETKTLLGDDLGANRYFLLNLNLMACKIPYIEKLNNARIFSCAEILYYPAAFGCHDTECNGRGIAKDLRASIAFGINVPITPMLHLSFYYSIANWGTRFGDVERTNFINFNFGFF
jgi:hypothetical protein